MPMQFKEQNYGLSSNWSGTLYNHRLNDQMGLLKYMYVYSQKAHDLIVLMDSQVVYWYCVCVW